MKLGKRLANADQQAVASIALAAMGIECAMNFIGLPWREARRDQEGVRASLKGRCPR